MTYFDYINAVFQMNVTILKGYSAHNENVAISGSDVILRSYENIFCMQR